MHQVMYKMKGWYYSQPFFTRTYLSICIVFTILISLNLISSYHMFYTFSETFFRLNIWRPLTAFFFIDKLDFAFLISLYLLYFSLYRLQAAIATPAQYAQFLWMVMLLLGCCIAVGSFLNVYFLTDMFISAVVFISSRKVPSKKMHLFFKICIESAYLPIAYLVLMLCFGHYLLNQVFGLILGALYLQILKIGEENASRAYLSAPSFLVRACQRMINRRQEGKRRNG